MGWFSKKSESFSVDELLEMSDRDIAKALRLGKAPVKTAKELRQIAKTDRRRLEGEKGFQALRSATVEQSRRDRARRQQHVIDSVQNGKDPHAIARMKAQDPKGYQRLLEQEAKRQGLL